MTFDLLFLFIQEPAEKQQVKMFSNVVSSPLAVGRLQDGQRIELPFSSLQLQTQTDNLLVPCGEKGEGF